MIACTTFMLAVIALPAVAQEGHDMDMDHEMHHAAAPSEGLRAELIADVEQVESKIMGLAHAMEGHYDYRPMEGVRSAGELFGHVANANFMIPSIAGLDREMADTNFEQVDAATMLEGLEHSFMHAKHSIADIPDSDLEDTVNMFGQEATKRQVLTLLVTHMHEHLGQAIAYARANGVTPPWSM
jgi:uncharacterized damage-inducible protein DinB